MEPALIEETLAKVRGIGVKEALEQGLLPLPDGMHLRLGITMEGVANISERIGFGQVKGRNGAPYGEFEPGSYVRGEDMSWISSESAFGENAAWGNNHSVMGYDFAAAIRTWLTDNGYKDLSMCEVLLAEGSPHVGRASVFWSHLQMPPIHDTLVRMWVSKNNFKEVVTDETFFWLDFPVLRQCHNDFDLQRIQDVVKEIGRSIVELYMEFNHAAGSITRDNVPYLLRSFCILEVFATLNGGGELFVQTNWNASSMKRALETTPINCAAATTRSEKQQEIIQNFIKDSIGFEKMDAMLTQAVLFGSDKLNHKGQGVRLDQLTSEA